MILEACTQAGDWDPCRARFPGIKS